MGDRGVCPRRHILVLGELVILASSREACRQAFPYCACPAQIMRPFPAIAMRLGACGRIGMQESRGFHDEGVAANEGHEG